ncbi:MAG: hypothetical protein JSR77_12130 [Planctomycetes bacterium]|nr:hypothetical protein [Planctomycetota bacterium]
MTPHSITRWQRDDLGRIWKETRPFHPTQESLAGSQVVVHQFDQAGNETRTTTVGDGGANAVMERVFDGFNRPVQEKVLIAGAGAGAQWATSYRSFDARGNIVREIDPDGARTDYVIDSLNRTTEERMYGIDPDALAGSPIRRVVSAWRSTGGKSREVVYSGTVPATQKRWEYDACGALALEAEMANPASSGAINATTDRVTEYARDAIGRELESRAVTTGKECVRRTQYDVLGRVTAMEEPEGQVVEQFTYGDAFPFVQTGRTLSIAGVLYGTEQTSYGRNNLPTQSQSGTSAYGRMQRAYVRDGQGRVIRAEDRDVQTQRVAVATSAFDGLGREKEARTAVGTADERVVTSTYTRLGHPEAIIVAAGGGTQTTSYAFDLAGRRTGVTHPDGSVETAAYSPRGDLTRRTRGAASGAGQSVYYERDWMGNAKAVRVGSATGTPVETTDFDALGREKRIATVGGSSAEMQYAYGSNGPAYADGPVQETQCVVAPGLAPLTRGLSRQFDRNGLVSLTYPADCGVALSYSILPCGDTSSMSRNGQPFALFGYRNHRPVFRSVRTWAAAPTSTWIDQQRTLFGLNLAVSSLTFTSRVGTANGQGGTAGPLALSMTTNPAPGAIELDIDGWDNPVRREWYGFPVAGHNGVRRSTYDAHQRLVSAQYPDSTAEQWSLDVVGNWNSVVPRFGGGTMFTHDTANRYLTIVGAAGGTPPRYDGRGNLTRDQRGIGYSYDHENRLTLVFGDTSGDGEWQTGEATYASFGYDGFGRRVWERVLDEAGQFRTTRRVFDGQRVIAEYDESGAPTRITIYGPDGLDDVLAVRTLVGGAWVELYPLRDELGTTVALADSSGALFEWYDYTAYGLPVRGDSGAAGTPGVYRPAGGGAQALPLWQASVPNLFTGQRLNTIRRSAGDSQPLYVYDYKARVYDPVLGRFLQRDPMEFVDSHCLYEYVRGNPRMGTDPTGMFEFGIAGQAVMMAVNGWMDASGTLEEAQIHLTYLLGVWAMFSDYRIDQILDVDWALDMNADDLAYSKAGPLFEENQTPVDMPDRMKAAITNKNPKPTYPPRKNAWTGRRPHGNLVHQKMMRTDFKNTVVKLKSDGIEVDYRTVRTNQALVDASGKKVSSLMPDVQFVDNHGNIHIVESLNTQTQKSLDRKIELYREIFRKNNLKGRVNGRKLP